MPHINQRDLTNDEIIFSEALKQIREITTKGKLEFFVAQLMDKFMSTRDCRYSDLHDCKYAVDHCAYEFGRLYLDKREDEAIKANGNAFES